MQVGHHGALWLPAQGISFGVAAREGGSTNNCVPAKNSHYSGLRGEALRAAAAATLLSAAGSEAARARDPCQRV